MSISRSLISLGVAANKDFHFFNPSLWKGMERLRVSEGEHEEVKGEVSALDEKSGEYKKVWSGMKKLRICEEENPCMYKWVESIPRREGASKDDRK